MSSAKTERLVNLTMALLGSRRFMTKSEIFRRVSGYSGSSETKERMFERDKDDLRSLGIEIEVASHDPLFEDEVGYRIRPETFQLQQEFDSEELGLIALALNLVSEGDLAETSNSLWRRVNSLAISPEMPEEIRVVTEQIPADGLSRILTALTNRTTIRFGYRKSDDSDTEIRTVNPLGIGAWRGSWYLVGEDLSRDDVRVFKLTRVKSDIEVISKPGAFSIPADFDIKEYLVMLRPKQYEATLKLRKNSGMQLRNEALAIESVDEEWDQIRVLFVDLESARREVLWLVEDVVVIEPNELRDCVQRALRDLVAIHG